MSNSFFDSLSLDNFLDEDEKKAIRNTVTNVTNLDEKETQRFLGSRTFRENEVKKETAEKSFFEKERSTVADVFNLQSKYSFVGYSHNAIEHNDIDKSIFDDVMLNSTQMQQTMAKGKTLSPTFEHLYEDLFYALFKYDATLKDSSKIHFSIKANYAIIKELVGTAEFIALRQAGRNDVFNAAYGCELLGDKLIKAMEAIIQNMNNQQINALNDLLKHENQINQKQDQIQQIDDLIQDLIMIGDTSSAEFNDAVAQRDVLIKDVNGMYASGDTIAQICDVITDPTDDTIDKAVNVVEKDISNATFAMNEASDQLEAWGLDAGGGGNNVGIEGKRKLLEAIRRSKKLKKLTDMVGRFKDSANEEQKKKSKFGKTDISSVTLGNDVVNMIPSEKMNLAFETTKPLFYKKYAENSTMQYQKSGKVSKNKGPIIAMIDTSGSIGSEEEMWEKALACGMLEIAQLQKRDFACIIYSGHADDPIVISKKEIAPDKILKIAETYHGGGTSFVDPLNKALKLIESSQFKNADMIMLTDGQCSLDSAFKSKFKRIKEEKEFTVYGILVDIGGGSRNSQKSLEEFCDEITTITQVSELTDPDSKVVKTLFGSI